MTNRFLLLLVPGLHPEFHLTHSHITVGFSCRHLGHVLVASLLDSYQLSIQRLHPKKCLQQLDNSTGGVIIIWHMQQRKVSVILFGMVLARLTRFICNLHHRSFNESYITLHIIATFSPLAIGIKSSSDSEYIGTVCRFLDFIKFFFLTA